MPNHTTRASLEEPFVSAFEHLHARMPRNGTGNWLGALRHEAMNRFGSLGFPSRKDEAWKYTNIGQVLRRGFRVLPGAPIPELGDSKPDRFAIPGLDAHLVVLLNGRFVAEHSRIGTLPSGVIIDRLGTAEHTHPALLEHHFGQLASVQDEPFTALNTAFATDGLFVYVPKGGVLDKPIHLINLQKADDDSFMQPRRLFVFEENAQATIVNTLSSLQGTRTFTNAVDEVFVGQRAIVEMVMVQHPGNAASLVSSTNVHQEGSSVFTTTTITFDGDVIRNDLSVTSAAEYCETHLYGLFLPRGDTHVDNHTFVDHAAPDCTSNELYKGVIDDRASGVFNGKVYVRQDAQRINAFQENKCIVLTDEASMNSKPELEIYADDVKCSHGATTGRLDPEAVFYLRSRGLPRKQAEGMLLHAFTGDVIERIGIGPLRTLLDQRITSRFGW